MKLKLANAWDKILGSRDRSIKVTIILGLLFGFLFSPHLWTSSQRYFPLIAPIAGIPQIPFPIDVLIIVFFFALTVIWIFIIKTQIGLVAIGILIVILLQDQMRWQPWVYIYVLMLLPFLFQSNRNENAKLVLNCLQWIIAGIYIWSGIHKLNPGFLDGTFTQMLLISRLENAFSIWREAGYTLSIIEILVGLALLSSRFRKVGVCLAMITHAIILLYLSPFVLNQNSVVYPWNVAMIAFVFLLFWNIEGNIFSSIKELKELRFALLRTALIILVWIFPIFNFFGYWDHYLSFSFYSDKPPRFYIAIEESELMKIDKRLEKYFVQIPGLKGGQLIDVDKWAINELNVPFYPELRSFRSLSKKFCELGIKESNLVFLEKTKLKGEVHFVNPPCSYPVRSSCV